MSGRSTSQETIKRRVKIVRPSRSHEVLSPSKRQSPKVRTYESPKPSFVLKGGPKKTVEKTVKKKCYSVNSVGLKFFEEFVKHYRENNWIGGEKDHLHEHFRNHRITREDYDSLLWMLDNFQKNYDIFIERVRTEGTFIEKSGSGGKPIVIKTPAHWMEAIIQLQNTLNQVIAVYKPALNLAMTIDGKKKSCKRIKNIADCDTPCSIKRGKCTYKPKK